MGPGTRRRSRWWLGLGLAAATWLVCPLRCSPPTTLATFNIQMFPLADSDPERIAELLVATEADLIAVQEIRDAGAFEEVVALAAAQSGRDLKVLLSDCLGSPRFLSPGLVYDAERLTLVEVREYPQLRPDRRGSCSRTNLPGLMGIFTDRAGVTIAAMSVHFRPYASNFDERREQLDRALRILHDVEDELGAHVVLAGDFNTTGFLGEPAGERGHFEQTVRDAGFELTTTELDCTEYWLPKDADRYVPSLLDHIVLRGGDWGAPEVMGMCAAMECQATAPQDMHPDYRRASDHCPVRITGDW